MLQVIFEAVRAVLPDGRGLLVNYTQLPDAVPQDIARHFGLELDDRDFAAIAGRAQRDAKTPGLGYEPRDEPDAAVAAEDAALVETLVMPAYAALEALRLAASR
jgi:beta-phosphoglucomutase-like phosphatase (HAD superfamily)